MPRLSVAKSADRPMHVGKAPSRKPARVRIGDAARIAENETTIHIDILRYLRAVLPDAMIWHAPNGGLRSKREAEKLQRMGVTAGIPDLIAWLPGGTMLALEVKTSKGRLSPDQKVVHEWMRSHGYRVAVVRSIDETREALKVWRIWTREAAL